VSDLLPVVLPSAALLCALFGAVVLGGLLIARDALVPDYPPAIRERYGPRSALGTRVARLMGAANAVLFAAVPVAGMLLLRERTGAELGFWPGFWFGVIVFAALNLFDLLVLDWWLFCTVRPRILVLPGTEGMAEYGDRAFHARVLWPGVLIAVPGYGALIGAATVAVEWW
jgi:hypothetical protein